MTERDEPFRSHFLEGRHILVAALIALSGLVLRYAVYSAVSGDGSLAGYVQAMCEWDCTWYESIAVEGYDSEPGVRFRPGGANWAFFPLSPLIAGAVSALTTLPVIAVGFVLSNLYALAAAIAARPLFANAPAYWLYVVMMLAGPFSFLFSSLHTEGLFVLLTVLAFVSLKQANYLAAGGVAALLSATRLTGILIGAALLLDWIVRQLPTGVSVPNLLRRALMDSRLLLALAIAPLGLVGYMAFLRAYTGDGLAFLHIQRAWGRELGNPLESAAAVLELATPSSADAMLGASWVAAAIVGLGLSVALAIRRRWPEALFCASCIIVSLAGGSTSMVRFVAGLAPLGMVLAELLTLSRITYVLAFPAAIGLGALLTVAWLRSSILVM